LIVSHDAVNNQKKYKETPRKEVTDCQLN